MTEAERYKVVQSIFEEVLSLPDDERAGLLSERCGNDASLRAEVERLLAHDREPIHFMKSAGAGSAIELVASHLIDDDDEVAPIDRIGSFDIVRILGEGGMGVVYEARQSEPNRRVALKILRPSLTSRNFIRRFRHEVDVLGRLQHRGIARIYEAGAAETSAGPRHYFAMEYVDGPPLTDFARSGDLSLNDRLELIAECCDAVHHAHQRGIIHRDLKPSNILIEDVDGAPQPKVLDFGIARITDPDMRSTIETQQGQLIGTLAYMSPEQAAGDLNAIDLRTDVYSLGVIAYELLTGRLPHDVEDVLVHEAVRRIQADVPQRMRTIAPDVPRDVEIIISAAMEKAPARRYQSVAELRADIRRYLAHEPVLARAPSAVYQISRFARRHRAAAIAMALAALALLSGAVTSTFLMFRSMRAEHAERAARIETDRAREEAEEVGRFLANMLGAADPEDRGVDVRLIDLLDDAARAIDEEFPDLPAVRSRLHRSIGISYRNMGKIAEAESELENAVRDARIAYDTDHPNLLRAWNSLAIVYDLQGRFDKSVPLYREILAYQQRVLGPLHRDTLGVSCNLGLTLYDMEDYDPAERVLAETVERMSEVLDPTDKYALNALQGLGTVYLAQERWDEAESCFNTVLDLAVAAYGPNDQRAMSADANLSDLEFDRGGIERSLEHADAALRRAQNRLETDWRIASMQYRRGRALIVLKHFKDAEDALLKSMAILDSVEAADPELSRTTMEMLVQLYVITGDAAAAEQWENRLAPTTRNARE